MYELDKNCPELLNMRNEAKVENLDAMFKKAQAEYKNEDIEVSTVFPGCLKPFTFYSVEKMVVGDKVDNGDHYTNVEKSIENFVDENKNGENTSNFAITVWHNHQHSTNFSVPDIKLLFAYEEVYEIFLDSNKVIGLAISESGKEMVKSLGSESMESNLRRCHDYISSKYDYREILKSKIDNKEQKAKITDALKNKIHEELINDLTKSGMGITMKCFDKIDMNGGC